MKKIRITTVDDSGNEILLVELDRAVVNINQEVYGFSNFGDIHHKDMAPSGKLSVLIYGERPEAVQKFQELCTKYDRVEMMG
jgi:hypothetical protein